MKKRMTAGFIAVATAVVMVISLMPVMGTVSHSTVGMVEAKAALSRNHTYGENDEGVGVAITQYNDSSSDKGSIRYIPKSALELTDGIGGCLVTDENGKSYYHYFFDLLVLGQVGDKLEISDDGGNVSVYTLGTYNDELVFINDANRRDRIDSNFLQSYDWATLQEKDHWYAGNTYSFHLSYEDMECELSVTVRENPVASIQFESQTEWLLFEGYSGQEVEDENGDTYFYYSYVDFQEGDTLTVSFSDGRVAEYEYTDEYFVNKENESDTISAREVYLYDWCGESSGNGHWQAGNTYQVQLSYNGRLSANTVPVKILTADETSVYLQKISGMIQNLPEESEFTLDDKETIATINEIEHADMIGLLDRFTGDLNKYYVLQYALWQLKNIPNLPEIKSGDTETVSISGDDYEKAWKFCPEENGSFMLDASSRYAIVNVMEDNKLIASIDDDSNKLFFDAEAGHTYAIRCYHEKDRGSYTIQLTANPIESIRLEPVRKLELVSNQDGDWDWVYDDKGNRGDKYFYYWGPILLDGDKLIVTKDGKEYTYVFNDRDYTFVNAANKKDILNDEAWYIEDDQYENHWSLGKDYEYVLVYHGKRFSIPVSIIFQDVVDGDTFFYDPVYWAVDEGITTGWSDGTFRPWNTCNRAAVVTFLWRLAGKPEPKSIAPFKDMPANTPDNQDFRNAISWAVEEGITTGWSDNTFRPWNTCNRAAIMTFIWRYAGKPASRTSKFKDSTGNKDFDAAISWASETGISTGWSDGTFRPWNTCNRAAVVSFLYRYANE